MIDFQNNSPELRICFRRVDHHTLHTEGPWQDVFGWTESTLEQCKKACHLDDLGMFDALISLEVSQALVRMRDTRDKLHHIAWKMVQQDDNILGFGTDQTIAYQHLAASESKYRQMVEYGADLWYLHNTHGDIVQVNQAAMQLLGYTEEELLALKVYDVEMTVKPHSLTGIWNRMTMDQTVNVQGRQRRKDGTTFPVGVALRKFDTGEEILISALARDISKSKEMEAHLSHLNDQLQAMTNQAMAANHSKSAFLANMSHELRTPLNAIIGYSELMSEEMHDAGLTDYDDDLKIISGASSHLLTLINDILDLSKIEAGKLTLSWSNITAKQLLQPCIETVRPLARAKSLELILELEDPDLLIETDVFRFRQILINLLSNAIKFTPDGQVALSVLEDLTADGPVLQFKVRDTGVGIAQDALEALFDPFVQASAGVHRKDSTGLGLSISKRLCKVMGGDIFVESTLDRGSTFTLILPKTRHGREKMIKRTGQVHLAPDAPRVMVVSDDAERQALLSEMIHGQGMHTLSSSTAYESLARIRSLRPDVILTSVAPSRAWQPFWDELMIDPHVACTPLIALLEDPLHQAQLKLEEHSVLDQPFDQIRLINLLNQYAYDQQGTALVASGTMDACEIIQRSLELADWRVQSVTTMAQMEALIEQSQFDVLILDLSVNDLALTRMLSLSSSLPIVMLSQRNEQVEIPAEFMANVHAAFVKGDYQLGQFFAAINRVMLNASN